MTHRPSPRSIVRGRTLRLAAAGAAAALVLTGCGSDAEPDDTANDPEPSASPSSEAPAPSESAAPEESEEPAEGSDAVAVYFVGDGPSGPSGSRGPVLFREFQQVGDGLQGALDLLLAGDALDPDYRSPLPDGAASGSIAVLGGEPGDGGQASMALELTDPALAERPAGMSAADATLAVQAIVYTVQASMQEPTAVSVSLASSPGEPTTLFGVDTAQGLTAEADLDVMSLVSISDPGEGDTVSGTFTATGIGSSFEATIPWQIRRGDEVVESGFTTAEGWIDRLYPWEAEVDVSGLEPGEYTFVALTDDPTGGAEGFGPAEDTRTIVVE